MAQLVQPLTYYTTAASELERWGLCLEKINPQQLCLMGATIYDHMAAAGEDENDDSYGIEDSLESIDKDCLMGLELQNAIVQICTRCTGRQLAELHLAIANYVVNRAYLGAWD